MASPEIPLAPYPPPAEVWQSLPDSQWGAILASWSTALSVFLQLPDFSFAAVLSEPSSLVAFLRSYVAHASAEDPGSFEPSKLLRKKAFLVAHRALSVSPPSQTLLAGDFLLHFAATYYRVPALRDLLDRPDQIMETALTALRAVLLQRIKEGTLSNPDEVNLQRLFASSPAAAADFLAGDEFVDTLVAAAALEQPARVYGRALISASKKNWSVVCDGLYALVSTAERNPHGGEAQMVKMLVEVGIGQRLEILAQRSDEKRIAAVVGRMNAFGTVKKRAKSKRDKGKGKAAQAEFAGQDEAAILSKINAVKELFSDIPDEVAKWALLVHDGDVEAVTRAILEDNLPSPEDETVSPITSSQTIQTLPQRRNKYDNDELDNLTASALKSLSLGARRLPDSIDKLPDRVDKSKILSLTAFDSDDDERDDTYDQADVGGAVDTSGPPGEEYTQRSVHNVKNIDTGDTDFSTMEKKVYAAWKRDWAVFNRDAATRRSTERKKLREETGWTDEALEGWAVMLGREPSRARRLERRFEQVEAPRQMELKSTRWTADGENSESGSAMEGKRGRGSGGGRSRGGGRRRRGGGDGSPSPADVANERRRSEQNKSSRANHSRRDQRARKMARGGFVA